MNRASIIIIGKTGAGKSTLINAILGEAFAPTGVGGAVTKTNQVYTCGKKIETQYAEDDSWELRLYDTVGLELNEKITEETIKNTEEFLSLNTQDGQTDVICVWLCVNQRNKRFEDFELALVNKLSMDYEVPFSVILTQCIDEGSDIETQLLRDYPDVDVKRVLAEDYVTRAGVFPAFGVEEAVFSAVREYPHSRLEVLCQKLARLKSEREKRLSEIREQGGACIERYADRTLKIGFLPVGCIPIVHGLCVKMLAELNRIAGIDGTKGFAQELFTSVLVGATVTPLMAVPLLSAVAASAYCETIGESYLEALLNVIGSSTEEELNNNELVIQKIKTEVKGYNG